MTELPFDLWVLTELGKLTGVLALAALAGAGAFHVVQWWRGGNE